jgi:NAD-dependent deacetylase
MDSDDLAKAGALLRSAQRVTVLTGAGVSAESGVPTFRGAGGLWEGRPIEEVATPEGFKADPVRVWRFYQERRRKLAEVLPNPAHKVLARWQDRFAGFTLVTQNVDGLHALAGSRDVVELHGNLWRVRCAACGREREERKLSLAVLPPICSACGGMERPAVVWFGEYLPKAAVETAWRAAEACDALVVVGTSAVVYPAAGLIEVAGVHGARIVEVNPEASALAHLADVRLRGPAGVMLPRLDATMGED